MHDATIQQVVFEEPPSPTGSVPSTGMTPAGPMPATGGVGVHQEATVPGHPAGPTRLTSPLGWAKQLGIQEDG